MLLRALTNSTLSVVSLLICLMLSWHILSAGNFLFNQLYEYNGIEAQVDKYGPQNRNRDSFETTTKDERVRIFGQIVHAINNNGIGLEEITYQAPSGEIIDTFLTKPEIDHLEDVSGIISKLNKIFKYLTAVLLITVILCWLRKVRNAVSISEPFSLRISFVSILFLIFVCCVAVYIVGPQKVFYNLHEWFFSGLAPWHFYFQDSLMTTMLTEPLFGSIAILLVAVAVANWILLSFFIIKVLR